MAPLIGVAVLGFVFATCGGDTPSPSPPTTPAVPNIPPPNPATIDLTTLEDQFPDSPLFHLIEDNLLVMQVSEDLTGTDIHNGLPVDAYAREIFYWFDDVFDYLVFVSNRDNVQVSGATYYGAYRPVMNDTEGIGLDIYFDREFGSADKLRGVLHFPYRDGLWHGPGLHEFQHAWANYLIPTAQSAHWGFSSANGQLGGFDRDVLFELREDRYSAGSFGTIANGGNSVPYSPIELYLAGYIAPEEVPDLWVAADGEWVPNHPQHAFTATDVRDYTIQEIVREYGRRIPHSSEAQRDFRAAVVLLIDSRPVTLSQAQNLSQDVRAFSHPDIDGNISRYNYYEATGGRGTIAMGDLSQFRKASPGLTALPVSFGEVPPPIACWPDGPGGLRHEVPAEP